MGSIAKTVGTIGGGVAGFFAGGPPGAIAGASLGNTLAGQIDGGIKNPYQAQAAQVTPTANPGDIQDRFNRQTYGLDQQKAFLQALQSQNGLQHQTDAYNQAQGIFNGTGPNPAQAQLAQNTAANTANQAALMAGQRGSSANPALIARQVAMQGAQNQQQSVGQAATLQAQQQLAAQQMMAQIAQQQASNEQSGYNQYNQSAGNAYGTTTGNLNTTNQINAGMQNNLNTVNAGVAAGNQTANNNLTGNLLGAAGSAIQLMGADKKTPAAATPATKVADANYGGGGSSLASNGMPMEAEGGVISGPRSRAGQHFTMMAKGGKVPALVSPGEQYLKPQEARAVAEGKAKPLQTGERIPGKPKHPGNDYRNDTVKKDLESGGVIIPNKIMQSKDAEKKAAAFVKAHLSKSRSLPKKG